MNRAEAIEHYLQHSPTAVLTVQRITTWDQEKTYRENAEILGISYSNVRDFANHWKLRAAGRRYKMSRESYIKADFPRLKKMRSLGYTLEQIGGAYGVSRQMVERVFNELDK